VKKNVSRNTAERSLTAKGFRREEDRDHRFYYLVIDGRETGIKTFFSHSKKHTDIQGDILSHIKRQLRLDHLSQAVDLLACPMSQEEYISILEAKGLLILKDND